jgi:alanyl-tRNA synthetase
MLGNWSLGDYFKSDQLPWFFEFLTSTVGLDANKLYVTCFIGDKANKIPKDTESAEIWKTLFKSKGVTAEEIEVGSEEDGYKLGMPEGGRVFYYDASKNWWCRAGKINEMPVGEPGGPDSEVFYDFGTPHNEEYGAQCHPNCDCGRFMEIGNSVFMEYVKSPEGFDKLPKRNVDFGGGLERISAAKINSPDVFRISIIWPIIEKLESLSGKKYDSYTNSMRVIADHLRAATFLAVDGIVPSNKEQGYVMRRLLRRAIRFAFDLGIEQNFLEQIVPVIADIYSSDFPDVKANRDRVIDVLTHEEKVFRQTLRKALKVFESIARVKYPNASMAESSNLNNSDVSEWKSVMTGEEIFKLYDTYGFPVELSLEEAYKRGISTKGYEKDFKVKMNEQRDRSQTATKGEFKGGLGGQTDQHKKYHTATHLMYQSLRTILGDHVIQHGSNITEERLRFDFSHPEKMTTEQIQKVEDMVNEQIDKDLKVTWEEHPTDVAINDLHVLGAFGDRYGDIVKVYRMQADNESIPFSFEICGGPHVEHTLQLTEGNKKFKIIKEESSSSGIRRIKAVLN